MLGELERKWPWWDDALLTVVVGYMSVQETHARGGSMVVSGMALAAVASLTLVVRHRWTMLAAVLAVAAALLLGAALPLVVMLFHLASANRITASVLAAGVAVSGNLLMDPAHSLWAPHDPGPVILLVLPLALGMWAGERRRLVATLADRVARLRSERALRTEHARMAERARIAAEMHDVLAHRLSVIALHTGALRRRAATLPPQVATRIELLRTTSTEALDDLRDLLGALRNPATTEETDLVPSVPELPALLTEARTAGQVIDAVVEGDPATIPASHRLAVHRTVREGLTNVRKHADGAPARLTVRYGPPVTTLRISNDLTGKTTAGSPGFGLIGLAERIHAVHGTLEYGCADGAWHLTARLPAPAKADSETPEP